MKAFTLLIFDEGEKAYLPEFLSDWIPPLHTVLELYGSTYIVNQIRIKESEGFLSRFVIVRVRKVAPSS